MGRKSLMGPDKHVSLNGADVLLMGLNTLAPAERELIAIHVSAEDGCVYCQTIHSAIASHHLGGDEQILAQVKQDFRTAPIPEKLKALLYIAGKVRGDGRYLTDADVQNARKLGATDLEIHDTLLIASMFCMCSGNGWPTGKTSGRAGSNLTQRLVRKTRRNSRPATRLKEHELDAGS
jgi:AhpD family alkylhydroperoxidase